MAHPDPVTLVERQAILDLYAEGACVHTICAIMDRSKYTIGPIIKATHKGVVRMFVRPKKDRWEWAFARAGWPRYEDDPRAR